MISIRQKRSKAEQLKLHQMEKISPQKIGIIGFGNIGQALCRALIKVFGPKKLYVCDHNPEKFAKFPGINICKNAAETLKKADITILSVKPQGFEKLAKEYADERSKQDTDQSISGGLGNKRPAKAGQQFLYQSKTQSKKLIISIMAGVSIAKIKRVFLDAKIVRAMPNLAVKVGHGATAWYANNLNSKEAADVKAIFASAGYEIELESEELLHAVTALSGSGPAYFYYLAEILADAGEKFGLSHSQAEELARHTFIGAAKLLEKENGEIAILRQAVTSKGGTTEAALKSFAKNRIAQKITEGLKKAKKRSEELAR